MNHENNFPKIIMLWAGELISAIGSRLTSFGLRVDWFPVTDWLCCRLRYGWCGSGWDPAGIHIGVGRLAAWIVMAEEVLPRLTAAGLHIPKSVQVLEQEPSC